MSGFDVTRARVETRYCEERIHFNNAGSSLMPIPVSDYLHAYLYAEERYGGYETVAVRKAELDNFYSAAARLLNCQPQEIAYAENATRAWDMAFYSFRFQPGDKILTTISEYGSNVIAYLQQAQRMGVELIFVPNDERGQLDVQALEKLIDSQVKLISMSHIPTGGGLVNPAAAVGEIAQEVGIPFLLDACQSMGQIPVDVQAIGCDMASGTGRKLLRGPRGTGLLYVREDWIERLEPPLLDQHAADLVAPDRYVMRSDAKRFENWEQYFAGKAALGVAINYALDWGIENIQARVYALAAELRSGLAGIPGVRLTDEGAERCGIVTFDAQQLDAYQLKSKLAAHKINVSVADGSGSRVTYSQRGIEATVRASLHYFNNEKEIERFCAIVDEILSG